MESILRLVRDYPDQVNATVAVLALLVSALSIMLTVASLYLQRKHNYRSLTPIASIPIADYENKLGVRLKNSGVGPLIIDKFRVTDGRRTGGDLISFMPGLPSGVMWDTFHAHLDGLCIPPGESLIVLQLIGDPDDQRFAQARDSCRKALRVLEVSVSYKDIYARQMPVKMRDLSWFGRHFMQDQETKQGVPFDEPPTISQKTANQTPTADA